MIVVVKNRRGRKRKTRVARHPSGRAVTPAVDYLALAERTPHRIRLPAAYRGDPRAECYLGHLNIFWRTGDRARGIPDAEYEAGMMYYRLVQAYLRLANAPRVAQLRDIWGKSDNVDFLPVKRVLRLMGDEDKDEKLTQRYMRAYEAVSGSAGHRGHMALNRVLHDQGIYPDQMGALREALAGLAKHFGLTRPANRANCINS